MTDPFADLERELLAAHGRRPRRDLRALPRAVAVAIVLAGLVVAAGWLGASADPERAATPQEQQPYTPFEPDSGPAPGRDPDADNHDQPGVTPVDGCAGGGFHPPRSDAPPPAEIASRLAVLEDGRAVKSDLRLPGGQVTRSYGAPVALEAFGDYAVSVVAADIITRRRVGRGDDPCGPPKEPTQPGVCLTLENRDGGLVACFTAAELDGGEAFLDVRGMVVGVAPDGARLAVSGDLRTEVVSNRFALPGGPETKVDFQP